MTVLDTNVVWALMQREADPAVVAWLDRQPSESLWTTAVTVFEIRFGLELLASGRRRRQLEDAFQRTIEEDFQDRILSFDYDAATEAAIRSAQSRAAGKPLDIRDLEIAGIVAARRATLATRNTRHFQDLGLELVDPWTSR
jgi:predicted nucleic acid-binding protein